MFEGVAPISNSKAEAPKLKKQYAPKIPFIPTYHHSGLPRQPKKYSRPDNASKMDLSGIIVGSKVIQSVW